MSERHGGSCLCGAVRFEVAGGFERFFLCHCTYCRKDTGSAHAANLFSSTARLTWLSGRDKVTRFDLPGTRHAKMFCSVCGSALPREPEGDAALVVPAGSLDGEVRVRPDAHLFTSSRASWDRELETVPSFARLPQAPRIRLVGIDHVQLAMPAGREDDARRFYVEILGLAEVPKPAPLAGRGGAWFELGAVRLHLGVEEDFRPARKAHPALLVRDLDALASELRGKGVDVRDHDLPGVRRAFVHDPFGNRIELTEPRG